VPIVISEFGYLPHSSRQNIINETIAKGARGTLCPFTYKRIRYWSAALLRAL